MDVQKVRAPPKRHRVSLKTRRESPSDRHSMADEDKAEAMWRYWEPGEKTNG